MSNVCWDSAGSLKWTRHPVCSLTLEMCSPFLPMSTLTFCWGMSHVIVYSMPKVPSGNSSVVARRACTWPGSTSGPCCSPCPCSSPQPFAASMPSSGHVSSPLSSAGQSCCCSASCSWPLLGLRLRLRSHSRPPWLPCCWSLFQGNAAAPSLPPLPPLPLLLPLPLSWPPFSFPLFMLSSTPCSLESKLLREDHSMNSSLPASAWTQSLTLMSAIRRQSGAPKHLSIWCCW
mmetsp:Transcript_23149/g.53054  ORF Transcript_23149/g.53054 Transcript_23149/m.53054 type:complete len:231 (+) Transcript_23149:96-788(+)